MTDRYTVTHSPFGFENDVGSHRLNYAVTDNRPDKVMVYRATEKARVLMTAREASEYLMRPVPLPPFRHLAYSSCKHDAEYLAKAMNLAGAVVRAQEVPPRRPAQAPATVFEFEALSDKQKAEHYDQINREIDAQMKEPGL